MKALLPAWVSFITHSFPPFSYSVVIFLLCLVDGSSSASPNPPEDDWDRRGWCIYLGPS